MVRQCDKNAAKKFRGVRELLFLSHNFSKMNLQSILYPIADFLTWTFEHLLVPIANGFNWICIAGGFVGIAIWLRMQKRFTQKAEREGGII